MSALPTATFGSRIIPYFNQPNFRSNKAVSILLEPGAPQLIGSQNPNVTTTWDFTVVVSGGVAQTPLSVKAQLFDAVAWISVVNLATGDTYFNQALLSTNPTQTLPIPGTTLTFETLYGPPTETSPPVLFTAVSSTDPVLVCVSLTSPVYATSVLTPYTSTVIESPLAQPLPGQRTFASTSYAGRALEKRKILAAARR